VTTWSQLPEPVRDELTRRLTRRQHDVLVLWLASCSYDRMARMLDISPRTVRTHLARAKQIYDDVNRKDAA
jgi:DNA-binding CsgD family transcriptional regulator